MKIKIMTIHVDDQAKALRFYSELLGFTKKADFSNGGYRWLTVASPEAPDGPELQLEANTNPAARAYQERPEDAVRCMIKAVETDPGETKYRDYLNKYVESLRATEGKERLRGIEDLLRQLPAK